MEKRRSLYVDSNHHWRARLLYGVYANESRIFPNRVRIFNCSISFTTIFTIRCLDAEEKVHLS